MTTPTELDGAVVLATARIADLRMLGLRRACARDDRSMLPRVHAPEPPPDPRLDPYRRGIARLWAGEQLVGYLATRVQVWWTVIGPFWRRRGVDPAEKVEWLLSYVRSDPRDHADGWDDGIIDDVGAQVDEWDDGKIPGWLPADVGTFMAQVRPSSCLTLGAASRGCALLLRARGFDSSSSPLAPAGDLPPFPRRAGERHGRGRRAGVTRRAGSCARSG